MIEAVAIISAILFSLIESPFRAIYVYIYSHICIELICVVLLMFMSPIRGNVRALHIGLGGIRK